MAKRVEKAADKAQVFEIENGKTVLNRKGAKIGVAENLSAAEVVAMIHKHGFTHIVQKNSLEYERELILADIMTQDPKCFLDRPLELIFGTSQAGIRASFVKKCRADQKKHNVISEFEDFVVKVRGAASIVNQAILIADELYTNSSKNSWKEGVVPFVGPPQFKGKIEFSAQADSKRLVISCRDSFGKLDPKSLIKRILYCYENGISKSIRFDTPGAGIGSVMIFDACASYYIGVEKGRTTVVCVALPLGKKRRAMAEVGKNIHLLEEE